MKKALFGPPVAEKIYNGIKKELAKNKLKPFLAVILVGENPESLVYIRAKEKIALRLGIGFRLYHFSQIVPQNEIIYLLEQLNNDKSISGIIVQLPLPPKFNTQEMLDSISPQKDIDGFSGNFSSPAAAAIINILKYYDIDLSDKKIVLLGHGRLVGQPLEKFFQKKGINVQVCDKETQHLEHFTKNADLLISATGRAGLIRSEMIKKGAIIIDAGTAEIGGKISGDVDKSVYAKTAAITPVPGGVGPVTVACLMENLVAAVKRQK